jgi:Papain fold toxin 1, glutamine deamidase
VSYFDLEPLAVVGSTSGPKVVQASIAAGAWANKVGWTLAENLENRSCPGDKANQKCGEFSAWSCDSAGCRCMDKGVAVKDAVAEFVIESIATIGFGSVRAMLLNASANKIGMLGSALTDEVDAHVNLISDLQKRLYGYASGINPSRAVNHSSEAEMIDAAKLRNWLIGRYPGSWKTNCTNCAFALDATMKGRPAVALPRAKLDADSEEALALLKDGWTEITNSTSFLSKFSEWGLKDNGIAAIVAVKGKPGNGHALNVFSKNGVVYFIDGQTKTIYSGTYFFVNEMKRRGWDRMFIAFVK